MKTIIERGASWTLEETKLLLTIWGQDIFARKSTCQKRTKEVYERISERFIKEGYERTPEQVRTRVFNMIAEYRRIMKDPNPERMKKCIFFEALHKIYQNEHLSDIKSALDDYELDNPYSPGSNSKSAELEDASNDGASRGADDTSMDTSTTTTTTSSTTINNVSNSNNSTNTTTTTPASKSAAAATNDTGSSKTSSGHATANNTSGSGSGGTNNKTSATSDNVGNSINDNSSAKKTPGSKDGQAAAKRAKLDSPRAGTSHGDTSQDNHPASASGDSKQNIKVSSNNIAGNLASNLQNASSTFTNNVAQSSSAKQQSLLATATSSNSTTPINKFGNQQAGSSFININSAKLPIIRSQILGHSNGNESININGTPQQRLPTTAAITSHQLYQAPVNTFDVTSSALLIDRMFAHLSKESENMREWIALEKERIALERSRRSQENEREVRRERVLIDTLMKFQEQWMSYIAQRDPRLLDGPHPELKISRDLFDTSSSEQNDSQEITQVSVPNKTGATTSSGATSVPATTTSSVTSGRTTTATTTTATPAAASSAAASTVPAAKPHATY